MGTVAGVVVIGVAQAVKLSESADKTNFWVNDVFTVNFLSGRSPFMN
jgi:hypothetical protein